MTQQNTQETKMQLVKISNVAGNELVVETIEYALAVLIKITIAVETLTNQAMMKISLLRFVKNTFLVKLKKIAD